MIDNNLGEQMTIENVESSEYTLEREYVSDCVSIKLYYFPKFVKKFILFLKYQHIDEPFMFQFDYFADAHKHFNISRAAYIQN